MKSLPRKTRPEPTRAARACTCAPGVGWTRRAGPDPTPRLPCGQCHGNAVLFKRRSARCHRKAASGHCITELAAEQVGESQAVDEIALCHAALLPRGSGRWGRGARGAFPPLLCLAGLHESIQV